MSPAAGVQSPALAVSAVVPIIGANVSGLSSMSSQVTTVGSDSPIDTLTASEYVWFLLQITNSWVSSSFRIKITPSISSTSSLTIWLYTSDDLALSIVTTRTKGSVSTRASRIRFANVLLVLIFFYFLFNTNFI